MTVFIVDGYNLIRRTERYLHAEGKSLLEGRYALLLDLEEFGAKYNHDVICVFDGSGRPSDENLESADRLAGVDVFFSGKGESADSVILKLTEEKRRPKKEGEYPVSTVVVTGDRHLQSECIFLGASSMRPEEFSAYLSGEKKMGWMG